MTLSLPHSGKGSDSVVGACVAQCLQVQKHLLDRAPLLARAIGFCAQPARQLAGEGVELGGDGALCKLGLHNVGAQILADGIARKPSSAGDLSDGQVLTQSPAPDDTQSSHVNHSWSPAAHKSSRLGLMRGSD